MPAKSSSTHKKMEKIRGLTKNVASVETEVKPKLQLQEKREESNKFLDNEDG